MIKKIIEVNIPKKALIDYKMNNITSNDLAVLIAICHLSDKETNVCSASKRAIARNVKRVLNGELIPVGI